MPKSSSSDMTTQRLKEPFDPSLDAPIALTPDQIEQVTGGFAIGYGWAGGATAVASGGVYGATTTGYVPPPSSIVIKF